MIGLFCVLNENTYRRLRKAFREVEWRKDRDAWVAEVEDDLADKMQTLCKRTWLDHENQRRCMARG